jgi:hypothetical protein
VPKPPIVGRVAYRSLGGVPPKDAPVSLLTRATRCAMPPKHEGQALKDEGQAGIPQRAAYEGQAGIPQVAAYIYIYIYLCM